MRERKKQVAVFLYIVVLATLLLAFSASPLFSASFDRIIGVPLRAALSSLSSLIPISLTELLLLSLLPLVLILSVLAFRMRRPLLLLLCLLLPYATLYTVGFAAGRYRPPIGDALGLELSMPTSEELAGCADWLSSMAHDAPSSPDEEGLVLRLRDALVKAGERYGIPVNRSAHPKETCTPLLSSLGFFGLYAFPLGEVTVVAECPASVRVFTAAHELAHAAGLLREEEADIFAFLACLDSKDPYLRHAAATGMLGRLLTALAEVDSFAWERASEGLPATVRKDLAGAGDVIAGGSSPAVAAPSMPYEETVLLLCAVYRARQ